jgi:hypothetical protein
MKLLHKFTVELEKEVEETSVKNENGQEITVKTKVKKKVPYTIAMKKLARRENDDFRLFYGAQIKRAIEAGLLTKAVVLNRHIDGAGGLMSKETAKHLANLSVEIENLRNRLVELGMVNENDTEKAQRQNDLLAKYVSTQQEMQAIESSNQAVFENTAETYAQERSNLWLIFNQTYIENGEKHEPMFKGNGFMEKEDYYFDLEEKEDPLYIAARGKLVLYWGLYSTGQVNTSEDFVKLDERLKSQEKEDEVAEQKEVKAVVETPPVETPVTT